MKRSVLGSRAVSALVRAAHHHFCESQGVLDSGSERKAFCYAQEGTGRKEEVGGEGVTGKEAAEQEGGDERSP